MIEPVRCVEFRGKINAWFPEKFIGFIDYQGRGEYCVDRKGKMVEDPKRAQRFRTP